MPDIQWKLEVFTGFTARSRNRLRKSKILNKIHSIRRQHPTLDIQVQRGESFIVATFADPHQYLMFALLWPEHYPQWETLDDISRLTQTP